MIDEYKGNVRKFSISGEEPSEDEEQAESGSEAYSSLVRRYGEAMIRIEELEEEVASLRQAAIRTTKRQPHNDEPQRASEDIGKLLNRIEELERQVSDKQTEQKHNNTETSQLRLQLASLANQLSQTEDELKSFKGHTRKHHHKRHKSKWKFWKG